MYLAASYGVKLVNLEPLVLPTTPCVASSLRPPAPPVSKGGAAETNSVVDTGQFDSTAHPAWPPRGVNRGPAHPCNIRAWALDGMRGYTGLLGLERAG